MAHYCTLDVLVLFSVLGIKRQRRHLKSKKISFPQLFVFDFVFLSLYFSLIKFFCVLLGVTKDETQCHTIRRFSQKSHKQRQITAKRGKKRIIQFEFYLCRFLFAQLVKFHIIFSHFLFRALHSHL